MRIKVQHNHKEIGPFSVTELQQATDTGRICMMDWCWDHDRFDGIMTVYQVLCDGGLGRPVLEAIAEATPTKFSVRQGAALEAKLKQGIASSEAARAAIDDYKRRLDHDLMEARKELEAERLTLEKEKEEFYKERCQMEAELSHAREDVGRARETIVEERKRLSEQYRRHSEHVENFNTMRRETLSGFVDERRQITEKWNRLTESEQRLNKEKEEWEHGRKRANTEAEEQRRRVIEELQRMQDAMRKLNKERAGFEERWQEAYDKLEKERRQLVEENRQLADQERKLRSEQQDFEEQRRRLNLELGEGKREIENLRKELDEERRQLERERRQNQAPRRPGPQTPVTPVVKDEKYFGRVLGLRGKISYDSIKKAYRAAAVRCHPDKVQDLHPEFAALATEMIREVNEAFDFFKARYEKK